MGDLKKLVGEVLHQARPPEVVAEVEKHVIFEYVVKKGYLKAFRVP